MVILNTQILKQMVILNTQILKQMVIIKRNGNTQNKYNIEDNIFFYPVPR